MKDIQTPLRTIFYNLLTGLNISCYENGAVPDEAPTPYAIISNMQSVENSNKSDFGNTVQTVIDIVTKYPKNSESGSMQVDSLAGLILSSINSKTVFPIINGLQIVSTKILQDQKQNDRTSTSVIYRRLIRFQQLIMEV